MELDLDTLRAQLDDYMDACMFTRTRSLTLDDLEYLALEAVLTRSEYTEIMGLI